MTGWLQYSRLGPGVSAAPECVLCGFPVDGPDCIVIDGDDATLCEVCAPQAVAPDSLSLITSGYGPFLVQ